MVGAIPDLDSKVAYLDVVSGRARGAEVER